MITLDEWMSGLVEELELPPGLAERAVRDLVLDLARDTAHSVARPAAPLTTFLLGVAAGRTAPDPAGLAALADRIRDRLPAAPADET